MSGNLRGAMCRHVGLCNLLRTLLWRSSSGELLCRPYITLHPYTPQAFNPGWTNKKSEDRMDQEGNRRRGRDEIGAERPGFDSPEGAGHGHE
jgi:hypothetical protein